MSEVVKNKGGRPVKFAPDNPCWEKMCEAISTGKSLSTALKEPGMPSYPMAILMIRRNSEIKSLYERATEDRADKLAEEVIELSDEKMPKGLEGPMASAWVQQKRLQIDSRKWVASKLNARRYGDKVDVTVTDTRISVLTALQEAKQRVLKDDRNVIDVEVKIDDGVEE